MTDYIEEIEEQDDDTGQLYEHLRIVVDKGQVPVRIDRFMTERLQHSSRNRIQKAADSGFVHVNERPVKSNYKVRPGDVITLMLDRPHHDTTIEAEEIPLDVVYEDEALMRVWWCILVRETSTERSSTLWLGICATCLRSTLTTLKWGWFTV